MRIPGPLAVTVIGFQITKEAAAYVDIEGGMVVLYADGEFIAAYPVSRIHEIVPEEPVVLPGLHTSTCGLGPIHAGSCTP